jgi:hypothetical protein
MNRRGVEFTLTQVHPGLWKWQFQIGKTVTTGKTQSNLMGMAARRVQQRIDRELNKPRDLLCSNRLKAASVDADRSMSALNGTRQCARQQCRVGATCATLSVTGKGRHGAVMVPACSPGSRSSGPYCSPSKIIEGNSP